MSLASLPLEVTHNIAECFEQERDFNALARTTRNLHSLLNPYLYKQNIRHRNSYALFWGLLHVELTTLQYALEAGADPDQAWDEPSPVYVGRAPLSFLIWQRSTTAEIPQIRWPGLKPSSEILVRPPRRKVYDAAIRLLLQYGASAPGSLVYAVRNDRSNLLPMLLEGGAHRRLKESESGDALVNAVRRDFDTVELLLDHGLDINAIGDRGGTAIQEAVGTLDCEKVRFLIERGASIHAGLGPPILFQLFGKGASWEWNCKRQAMLRYLLSLGADINAPDLTDSTLLFCTLLYSCPAAMFEDLLSLGADVHVKNSMSQTLLHLAPRATDTIPDLISRLHKLGLDVNAQRERGYTPLHESIMLNKPEAVAELLEIGADPHLRDYKGDSALDLARKGPASRWTLASNRLLDHLYRRSPRLHKRKRGE